MMRSGQNTNSQKIDWRKLLGQKETYNLLCSAAAKRFTWKPDFAEDAVQFAVQKMLENDCARLRSYSGDCFPHRFLIIVSGNLFIDFQRQFLPRLRPPAWVRRMGTMWTRVFFLLCRDRHEPETIIDKLGGGHERDSDQIWNAIESIGAQEPWCGERKGEIPYEFESEDNPAPPPNGTTNSLQSDIELFEFAEVLQVMATFINDNPEDISNPGETAKDSTAYFGILGNRLTRLRQTISLEANARLFLRMHFEDGLSVAEIARRLELPDHKIRRTLKKCLATIRTSFEQVGIFWDDL